MAPRASVVTAFVGALVFVVPGACRTVDEIDPSHYGQSCSVDSDCVTVPVGLPQDACCSECEASAIAKGSLGAYQKDLASLCKGLAGQCPQGPVCPLAPAVCAGGTCSTDPSCTTMLVCPDAGLAGD
jgi:hypothetical protein